MNEPALARPNIDPELLRAWLAVPEHLTAEIIGGELVTMPRPTPRHAHAEDQIVIELRGKRGRGPGGWVILSEPAVAFGSELFVPDVAGWCRERLPELPDEPRIELVPDWVCEILSPSTQGTDRARKMRTYAAFGVPNAWLVDPFARSLEAYRLVAGRWLQLGAWCGAETVSAEPFADVCIELAALWGDLDV